MEEIAISVEHVSKIYKLYDKPTDRMKESLGLTRKKLSKDHYALNDLNFQVKRGETVGIIGTNGAGKSTILKIITGVLNPTSGAVNINGRISALLELGAGFNMEYTGIENIYLNGTMIGFSKEEIDAKMDDILKFADIGDFVYQPCKTYSSGMFVRLAFAVAINIEPEILIVDEALSVGDVFFQAKCYKKFEEFKKAGKTILFVSHDLSSISKYCDRVVLLNQGTKLAEGAPKEMVDMYKKVLVHQLDEENMNDEETESFENESGELWKAELELNPDIQEYGEKQAEIVDIAVMDENGHITNVLEKGSTFSVKMKVEIKSELNDPIFALTIKNLQGTDITGTNTFYEGIDTGTIKAGETRVITFKQRLDLQGGSYLLSFGCTGYIAGEFHVFHRLYDFCNISVVSNKNTVGFYDMNSEINVSKI
ncbi:MAG: ABC transporter ATP-binding protein [Lachnospiraceae bacterium]|nr:ABC transporter ATP-binding protein [Lachnospiraceae bacterium]